MLSDDLNSVNIHVWRQLSWNPEDTRADACVGFTELFVDNGKDKNLTNCEVYRAREKIPIVCGELISLVGYIPGVDMKTDTKKKVVELTVGRKAACASHGNVNEGNLWYV